MPDPRWDRFGPALWVRFRALGVVRPFDSASHWLLAQPEQPFSTLWVEATRFALERGRSAPEPDACAAFLGNAAQTELLRELPVDEAVLVALTELDGLDVQQVAELTGRTSLSVRSARDPIGPKLTERATPWPEGSQEDGHPSTLDLLALLREELPARVAGQTEQHLANCPGCFRRLEAWTVLQDAFQAHAPPVPPPEPEDRRPVFLAVALASAAVLLVVIGGATSAWLLLQQEEVAQEVEALRPAGLRLLSGGVTHRPGAPLSKGDLLIVEADTRGAPHVALAVRQAGTVDVLFVGDAGDAGWRPLPVELLYTDAHEAVYVVLGARPFTPAEVVRLAEGVPVDGLTVAVHKL